MKRIKMKTIMLLAALLTMAGNIAARPITSDEAKGNAMAFLASGTGMKRAKGTQKLTLAYTLNTKDTNQPALYAFNIGDDNGFVITSGDDIAESILGYCETGSLDPNNIPDNVKAWLEGYANEISKAQASGYMPAAKSPAKAKATINPLVQSKWSQNTPYNNQCIFNNVRCMTGCSATAIAQIMYYWASVGKDGKTFKPGCTALPGYTTRTNGYKVPSLSAVSSFDWANMTNSTPTTTAAKAAVAKLMRYCGQAAETDFTSSGSAAHMSSSMEALKYNFGYNFGMKHIYAKSYTNNEWNETIYNELANSKPVFMSGYSDGEGHAFICDGYDASKSKYHFNWGWGGNYDGWFAMTALNPNSHNFNEDKDAIINIQPLDNSAYAILSSNASTLTLYYDRNRNSRTGTMYEVPMSNTYPKWLDNDKITSTTKVVFDNSFASARPESAYYWFYEMTSLSSITGMANLNTSEIKNTHGMFQKCSALTSIDLSHFNTAKVTDMSYMFYGCSGLTSLNASSFNTSNVTNMSCMFYGCCGLTNINVSNFNTDKVTNMSYMFYECSGLTSINVSNFNTAKVTNISYMFSKCSNLKSLDLSSCNFSAVTSCNYFCQNCSNLTQLTIPVSASYITHSYAFSNVGKSTAPCIITAPKGFDFGATTSSLYFKWKNGYFFLKGTELAYAFLKDNKITFLCDANAWGHDATPYKTANTGTSSPGWYSQREQVKAAVIDASFAKARPLSTYYWFSGMVNLKTVSGIENLNMSETANTNSMFNSCTSLEEITLPSTITQIGNNMFYNCSSLKTINVPEGVTTLGSSAFYNCSALESATLPSTLETISSYNFYKCPNLTSVTVKFTVPLTLASTNFSNRRNADLFVPEGCHDAFKAASYWKDFKWIYEDNSYAIGDVNHDGTVSLNDILITVSYILGENPNGFYKTNADIDHDGSISLADIMMIVDIILTQ